MTSNDGRLTGILMHVIYNEEMHLANIILRGFEKKTKQKNNNNNKKKKKQIRF